MGSNYLCEFVVSDLDLDLDHVDSQLTPLILTSGMKPSFLNGESLGNGVDGNNTSFGLENFFLPPGVYLPLAMTLP